MMRAVLFLLAVVTASALAGVAIANLVHGCFP
jgi:hypothetical protein